MLILVGVTINLATNGGLFEKSRTASKDTEQKKILEELIAMAEFDNDGKINVDSLIEKVGAKYDGSRYDQTNSKLTVKGNKGDFYYKVTDTEIKIWEDNNKGDGTTPEEKAEFAGKIYRSDEKDGEISITVFDKQENKYVLYRATVTEENGKITELTNVTEKLTDKFEIVTKESSEFETWLTKENADAADKGGTIYNIDSIEEKCIKIPDYGEEYYYGFFMDNYATANIDAELKQISDEEVAIFESAIANV